MRSVSSAKIARSVRRSPARLDDRAGPLHVRVELGALHEGVEVLPLEPVGGGQHVVGQLAGGVAVVVDGDEQVERGEGLGQAVAAADAEHRVAGRR